MTTKEKYEYWLEAAQYDLDSAKVMSPLTHNIWNIFRQLRQYLPDNEHLIIEELDNNLIKYKHFFVELLSYYISGRYPSFKEKISSTIDRNKAQIVLEKTEEAFLWIESLSQFKK